ncbi:STAS domain-containing protein [Aneurinibacillus sp. REN35]|uniref:STAS domain-containing protein n=1 Tax=Aneurinibacillus sp. REN35 TaxID=3237286 RepID=UPI0035280289
MNSIQQFASHLIEEHAAIGELITEAILSQTKESARPDEREHGQAILSKIVEVAGKSLLLPLEDLERELVLWSRTIGEQRVHQGQRLGKVLASVPIVRSAFIGYMGQLCIEQQIITKDILYIMEKINYTLDIAVNEMIRAFDQFKDKIISAAYEEVSELSAPIVPILKGTAVLPLIGSIDSHKANHILHNVIPKVAELKLHCLIIDFSGIHVIDTMVTDHIFKIHRILRLLGIHAVLTGIRPSLAQTAIGIGIDFSTIKTYATVQQALEAIQKE